MIASSEVARQYDTHVSVFGWEVIRVLQNFEDRFLDLFKKSYANDDVLLSQVDGLPKVRQSGGGTAVVTQDTLAASEPIIELFRRLKLIPQVIGDDVIFTLVQDLVTSKGSRGAAPSGDNADRRRSKSVRLHFPQWEWVMCATCHLIVKKAIIETNANKTIEVYT